MESRGVIAVSAGLVGSPLGLLNMMLARPTGLPDGSERLLPARKDRFHRPVGVSRPYHRLRAAYLLGRRSHRGGGGLGAARPAQAPTIATSTARIRGTTTKPPQSRSGVFVFFCFGAEGLCPGLRQPGDRLASSVLCGLGHRQPGPRPAAGFTIGAADFVSRGCATGNRPSTPPADLLLSAARNALLGGIQQAHLGKRHLVEQSLRKLGVHSHLEAAKMRHALISRRLDHVGIGFKWSNGKQPIVIRRPFRRWDSQPFVVGVECFGHGIIPLKKEEWQVASTPLPAEPWQYHDALIFGRGRRFFGRALPTQLPSDSIKPESHEPWGRIPKSECRLRR